MDIDLYEFKETLKEFEDDNFLKFSEEKAVAIVEVGKTTKNFDKKLIRRCYKKGEKALIIIQ